MALGGPLGGLLVNLLAKKGKGGPPGPGLPTPVNAAGRWLWR